MERWSLLGASRGFGRAFAVEAAKNLNKCLSLHVSSRKFQYLESLKSELEQYLCDCEISSCDFTNEIQTQDFLQELKRWQPTRLFYFAGGGPYGLYENKQWKDHAWAFQLNLIFPARLLYASLQWESLKQWVFIGSAIAESQPDPMASSYASSKHGLRGLVTSLQQESPRDIRLFSPGYMDTDLLPHGAPVRKTHSLQPPESVAQQLFSEIF